MFFFHNHFISIAETIDAKFKPFDKMGKDLNAADKGEICEIFIKDFLVDSLGDSFKIFRGGKIVSSTGAKSNQIDIILTSKNSIKLFGDKGIYPIETVQGCFSITSTLSKDKLIEDCKGLITIPKDLPQFYHHDFICKKELDKAFENWVYLVPYKVIFAFKGDIKQSWGTDMSNISINEGIPYSYLPDLVIVNKVGYLEKVYEDERRPFDKCEYCFTPFSQFLDVGLPFARILYYLNKHTFITDILKPEYRAYFQP